MTSGSAVAEFGSGCAAAGCVLSALLLIALPEGSAAELTRLDTVTENHRIASSATAPVGDIAVAVEEALAPAYEDSTYGEGAISSMSSTGMSVSVGGTFGLSVSIRRPVPAAGYREVSPATPTSSVRPKAVPLVRIERGANFMEVAAHHEAEERPPARLNLGERVSSVGCFDEYKQFSFVESIRRWMSFGS